jgi:hypothetical protein
MVQSNKVSGCNTLALRVWAKVLDRKTLSAKVFILNRKTPVTAGAFCSVFSISAGAIEALDNGKAPIGGPGLSLFLFYFYFSKTVKLTRQL